MFKRKNKEDVLEYVRVLQNQIDEILEIVEEQQKQLELLEENLKLLHQLCTKGAEQ